MKVIQTADWHLSLKPPRAREAEPDWLESQKRPLSQIRELWWELKKPVVTLSGDLFDKWNPPIELINWAIGYFPCRIISIPGNHDLPLHSIAEMGKSAYQTMTAFDDWFDDISDGDSTYDISGVEVFGFPFGAELKPWTTRDKTQSKDCLHIALVHAYCHLDSKTSFKDAPKATHADRYAKQLRGFDVAAFGDNHIPFQCSYPKKKNYPTIVNCGGLQRRTIDEIDHQPRVALIFADGHVDWWLLDCSEDKFVDAETIKAAADAEDVDLTEVMESLKRLGEGALDFTTAVKTYLKKDGTAKRVMRRVLSALEEKP